MMLLTKKERLALINQYNILKHLDAESADHYEKLVTILENGYELEYGRLDDFISEPMSEEECKEVLDVLSMFEALQDSYKSLNDKTDLPEGKIKFAGYDGNNEAEQMGYVAYLVKQDDRFTHVVQSERFNSHCPMVARYSKMLQKYKRFRQADYEARLTKEQILEIIA